MASLSLCLVLFFVTISLAAFSKPPKLDVDKIDLDKVTCPILKCVHVGPPICARRKDKLVLFPTFCALALLRCATGKTWRQVKLEKCTKDESVCPVKCNATKESSVCASNGKKTKKFKTECKFRNFVCENNSESWSRLEKC